eukprot:gb/GECG01000969.1/.p1 GENE.gb/GECG01000969.1/~~gb/GECG01000969.1/.p1  ORF type:complete len:176 (+),score=19.49 gb/GECG01000969.1/:1-528(+)
MCIQQSGRRLVRISQRKIPLSKPHVIRALDKIMTIAGYQGWDVGAWFCSARKIAELNRQYRDKKGTTDILSFPAFERPEQPEVFSEETLEVKDLGDMVICPEVLQHYCSNNKITWEEHLPIILTHGVVHLIGYDHVEDEEYKRMAAKEESILMQFRNAQEDVPGTKHSKAAFLDR